MAEKRNVFFCYAREDETLRKELEKQLTILKRQGFIDLWHDREIGAGTEWAREIDAHLNTADIILLLVSPDFMVSDYCYSIEMTRAMERHEAREACVIPVILRPTLWQRAPFGKLQALPTDGKPVLSRLWHNQDEAFYDIAEGIRKAVERLDAAPLKTAPSSTNPTQPEHFHVCLSYLAADTEWVENLAKRLRDEHSFRVHLDKRVLLSGQSWQQPDTGGTYQTTCYAVCVGERTPMNWFEQGIQRALDRQRNDPTVRVIPVLLPNVKVVNMHDFPELRVWADFRGDQDRAFQLLVCGVKGVPMGKRLPKSAGDP